VSSAIAAREDAGLRDIAMRLQARTQVPGLAVAMSMQGKRTSACAGLAALGHSHPPSDLSRFEMSCLMKLFSSLVALELHNEGILDIDVPVEEYVAGLRSGQGAEEKIRVRHLLAHSSGYRGVDISNSQVRWNFSWGRFIQHCRDNGQSFVPGSVFNYEHSEHVVLDEIISRTYGRTAPEAVRQRIFEPLGIAPGRAKTDLSEGASYVAQHTWSSRQERFIPMALPPFSDFWAGSLPDATLTLQEVLTVAEALLGTGPGSTLFSKRTLTQLQAPGLGLPSQVASGPLAEELPIAFGTGCAQYGHGVLGHNGSMTGQTCAVRIDPARGVAVAVGVNAWVPFARDRAAKLALALASDQPEPADIPGGSLEKIPFPLERLLNGLSPEVIPGCYLGSYFGEIHVCRDGRSLHFDLGPAGPRRPRISTVSAEEGTYVLDSQLPVSFGFFQDPVDANRPALMMGVHAYKRQCPA
jgi:CubicO group peptidase (beta-lactamase class C family)